MLWQPSDHMSLVSGNIMQYRGHCCFTRASHDWSCLISDSVCLANLSLLSFIIQCNNEIYGITSQHLQDSVKKKIFSFGYKPLTQIACKRKSCGIGLLHYYSSAVLKLQIYVQYYNCHTHAPLAGLKFSQ